MKNYATRERFTNKIWILKLIKDGVSEQYRRSSKGIRSNYEAKRQQTLLKSKVILEYQKKLMGTYKLVWDDFCSWF
jgi:valyl-tRNA synthetase